MQVMFGTAQWVNGQQVTQADVELDQIVGYGGGRIIVNVRASDLLILTAGDLPARYVDAVRAVLPNAHKAWSEQEDQALRELWERGVPVGEMVGPLGRRYKAIQSRARLLGLRSRRGGSGL